MTPLPLLQVKDLDIAFQHEGVLSKAVNKISFNIQPGELVALVGESGSGKSVTSLSLPGLLPKETSINGQLIFSKDGLSSVDLLQCDAKDLRQIRGKDIAMIFQEPMTSLNPVFTCGFQVMEAIRLHQGLNKAEATQKVISLFEQVKLPNPFELIHRYPHELSGGQKQRVMIAMAMSCNPSLLIADEPTTALDVTVQKNILELIKELQLKNRMGVLFITHDLGVVAEIADRIIVMYKGSIMEEGDARSVLKDPKNNYTKALLACRPAAHAKGNRLPVISDFLGDDKNAELKPFVSQQEIAEKEEMPVVLKVEDLSVEFASRKTLFGKQKPAFKAVNNVSFEVKKGEVVGLVGESGCGKTTLGRTILQLVKPTSGRILLDGKDIAHANSAQLRSIRKDLQIVFQDPFGSLNPRISIGNAIMEPMKVHGLAGTNSSRKDKVMELLEKVSLQKDHFNRYPHQFSGGQRQRICIARALALDPSFLVFDESVSALDVSVQAQVLNLVNDLRNEFGFTSLFISHDLSVVHYLSDRILVMRQGSIVESGTADQVYKDPQHGYTRELINAIPGKKLRVTG